MIRLYCLITPEALYLVQRVRDEAHRFARQAFHRSLGSKKNIRSLLDDIPQIGKKRRIALLKTLGSIDEIKRASVEELTKVPGMNKKRPNRSITIFIKELMRIRETYNIKGMLPTFT